MAQGTRRTFGQVVGVVLLAVAVAAFLSVAAVRHGFFDLQVYYGALTWWVHDGGELYDYLRPFTQYGFTYPPFAALVMLPMAYLPWPAAITVSVVASVVGSAVVIWWLVDPISRRAGWTRWFALAVALCLAAAYEPMRETINFGQVNMLLLVLVAVDLLRLLPAGNRWAGVGVGLATAIKLTPGVFIVYLLVTGRWRAAFTAMGAAAGATLLAAALFRTPPGSSGPRRCGTPPGSASWRSSPTSRCGGWWPGSTRSIPAPWPGWCWCSPPSPGGCGAPVPPWPSATRPPGWR